MIGAFRRVMDSLTGEGDYSVTVPPMDGALNPNNGLEEARLIVSADAPDNLCLAGGRLLFSSGNATMEIDRSQTASPRLLERFSSEVTSLAAHGGALAIGLAEGKVIIRGGPYDGRTLSPAAGLALNCVTALSFAGPNTLLVCNGSAKHPAERWKHDLMELGASGSVWQFDLTSGLAVQIADRLAFPFGVEALPDGGVIVSESWRHRLVKFRRGDPEPEVILSDLPAYPARISPTASSGGAWLALFAPRRQLTEFVLREAAYRNRMMAEVAPDHWVGPTLEPMKSFLEPLQGGTLKKLAAIKPWAPSRSYGLAVRLDEDYQPAFSFHSRADGSRHGIMSVVEADGRLYAASRGAGAVVAIDLSGQGN
jgi:hypothetical protein